MKPGLDLDFRPGGWRCSNHSIRTWVPPSLVSALTCILSWAFLGAQSGAPGATVPPGCLLPTGSPSSNLKLTLQIGWDHNTSLTPLSPTCQTQARPSVLPQGKIDVRALCQREGKGVGVRWAEQFMSTSEVQVRHVKCLAQSEQPPYPHPRPHVRPRRRAWACGERAHSPWMQTEPVHAHPLLF